MDLDDVCLNLTEEETIAHKRWFAKLRKPEKTRVYGALRTLNDTAFKLDAFYDIDHSSDPFYEDGVNKMAVVLAGSSIDSQTYPDIDLFLLSEYQIAHDEDKWSLPQGRVEKTFAQLSLPDFVFYIHYNHLIDNILEAHRPQQERAGVPITISLFWQLHGFAEPREGSPDDLIEPQPALGAEGIIARNRERNAKFLVLSRQYEI